MAFDAQQRKIYDLLSGDIKYVIPRYQRKYVWEEKQWRELLDDLKYCIEVSSTPDNIEWTHFLGSFVFEKDQKNMIVIDGQQRLTTIIIMLCAICTLLNEMGDEDRFRGVTKYIIGTDDLGKDFTRVDNKDLTNFNKIIVETTTYNKLENKSSFLKGALLDDSPKDNVNIKRCFYFFYNQFSDMINSQDNPIEVLTNIKNKIVGLDIIDIKATNEQESYNIFEILNARGVDLEQNELIKNYIFKYIRPKASIDTAKLIWDEVEKMLFIKNRSVMEQFFTHYVAHKFGKPSGDNTEFRLFKEHSKKTNMSELLKDIHAKARIYRWFYLPEECDNKTIRSSLQFFSDNNHRQFRPIFLSIISAFNNGKINIDVTENFFTFIKHFYFAYGVVCKGKSNTIEDMVYDYARDIENNFSNEKFHEMLAKLRSYYPPFTQFQSSFKLLGYSNTVKSFRTPSKKKNVQYILKTIEMFYQSTTNELSVSDFTIEHIANDDGTEVHCRIGNLLPLATKINNNAGDNGFGEKIEYYKKSNLLSVKKFVERYGAKTSWNEKDIDIRSEYMADLAYNKIWKL